jgi:hypothetical protein
MGGTHRQFVAQCLSLWGKQNPDHVKFIHRFPVINFTIEDGLFAAEPQSQIPLAKKQT